MRPSVRTRGVLVAWALFLGFNAVQISAQSNATVPVATTYDPSKVDWASVVAACRLAGSWEKRFRNFWIRAAFHDGLAVDASDCSTTATYGGCFLQNGLDASLYLSNEKDRPPNVYDNFTALSAVLTIRIATVFNTSVADALAVCSAVSVEDAASVSVLSKGLLVVGRVDSTKEGPDVLPAAVIGTQGFYDFFTKRGFTVDEGVALLGSHSLIDAQACYKGDHKFCDPGEEACSDVRMYNLDNHYYHELCTPTIFVKQHDPRLEDFPDTVLPDMNEDEFAGFERSELCKWTSADMRNFTRNVLDRQRRREIPLDTEPVLSMDAMWRSDACNTAQPGVNQTVSCPRFEPAFPYTVNDGFLGLACQGKIEDAGNSTNSAIKSAMVRMLDRNTFKNAFVAAFLKMVNPPEQRGVVSNVTGVSDLYEVISTQSSTSQVKVMRITGKECPSGLNATTGLCRTYRDDFGNFGLGLNTAPENIPTAAFKPSPPNRSPAWVFGASPVAIMIRRLDNAQVLSLAEVEVFTGAGVKLPLNASQVSSSSGSPTAGLIVDGNPATYSETDPNSLEHWFLVRLPANVGNVTQIKVTKRSGPQSSLIGTVVEVMNRRGAVTQLVTTTAADTFVVNVLPNALVAQDEAQSNLAAGNITFIIARTDGAPLDLPTVEIYSRRFRLSVPPGSITKCPAVTSPCPVRRLSQQLSNAVSCIKVSTQLSPLTRVDRIVIRSFSPALKGARIYVGQPENGASGVIPADLPAGNLTIFVGDTLQVVPGDAQEEPVFGTISLTVRRAAMDGPLWFGAAELQLFDVNKKAIAIGTAAVTTTNWIKVDLTKLPQLGWVVVPKSPRGLATAVDVETTAGTFSSLYTKNDSPFTTYVTPEGLASYGGTVLNTPVADNSVTFIVARYDKVPLVLSEVRFFDEDGLQITDGLSVTSSGSAVSPANPNVILDANETFATASGSPAWFAITLPASNEPARVVLVGGPNTTWTSLVNAFVYLRTPESTKAGNVSVPLNAGEPLLGEYDVVAGPATLVTMPPGSDTAVPSKTGPSAINPNYPKKMSDPPASPYMDDPRVCSNLGQQYSVRGFPSSFTVWKPFTREFVNPPQLLPFRRSCRTDGHCMQHFEINVTEFAAELGCGKPTTLVGYGGIAPGPTLIMPQGEESHVRFNNQLIGGKYGGDEHPCNLNGRRGRPISIHHHGSASTAPHDGWAENLLCGGESKDYFYPNNRAGTGWYHDHALDLTAENAYRGLAGFYIVTRAKGANNNCGQPWNLDNIPEYSLVLGDKLLDRECQLVLDLNGPHENDFYGDLNLVSGQAWPVLTVKPQTVRFRVLVGGPTRPYKLRIVNDLGEDVSGAKLAGSDRTRCQVVAGDGGFKRTPSNMPSDGLFVAVAERWELVCDFSDLPGTTLYLWNARDEKRGKHVPFFCFTHLLMKINVLKGCVGNCPAPASARLFEEQPGPNYRCGGRCYNDQKCELPDLQHACCAEGQYCWRNDQWNWYCRSQSTPAPTCGLYQPTRSDNSGNLVCGGKCYTAGCTAAPIQHACCPSGQFCWQNDEWNWYCRNNPTEGPSATQPAIIQCNLPKPEYGNPQKFRTVMDQVLNDNDYLTALRMAQSGKSHRQMKFGRRRGQWVINGETWFSFKIAARDVGQNTYEVWELDTGGGWFHPIHIHLVDFWVIRRDGPIKAVEEYEQFTPKDVVALHPSAKIWILARWGPHRGDYMFHCHNLIHEDRAMMRAFRVRNSTGALNGPTASNGPVDFTLLSGPTDIVYDLYNYKDPMTEPASTNPPPLTAEKCKEFLDRNIYRIFYPLEGSDAPVLSDRQRNPWRVQVYRAGDQCLSEDATLDFFGSNFGYRPDEAQPAAVL